MIWWVILMLSLDSFFFSVCVIYCRFSVCGCHEALIQQSVYIHTYIHVYTYTHLYKIVLSCWSFNFKFIYNILYLCSLHNCWFWYQSCWYPAFTVFLPLPINFCINNSLVSSCHLFFFSLKKFLKHLLWSSVGVELS